MNPFKILLKLLRFLNDACVFLYLFPSLAHSFLDSVQSDAHRTFKNSFSFKVFSSFVSFLLSFLFKFLTAECPKILIILSSLSLIVHTIVVRVLIILVIYVFLCSVTIDKVSFAKPISKKICSTLHYYQCCMSFLKHYQCYQIYQISFLHSCHYFNSLPRSFSAILPSSMTFYSFFKFTKAAQDNGLLLCSFLQFLYLFF